MTDVEEFLAHFGVKGMKWGQRKDRRTAKREQKQIAKKDKKWQKNAASTKMYIKVNNEAATKANRIDVPRINNKPEYKGKDFSQDSPLRRKYYEEHEQAFNRRMQQAVDKHIGSSPSGLKQVKIGYDGIARFVDVEHSEEGYQIVLKKDDSGHILSFDVVEDEVLEQADLVGEFLAHYGVKGMKWGVRRRRGGDGRVVSDDARNAREIRTKGTVRNKGTRQSVQYLSNKEIQEFIQRANLEKQFIQATPGKGRQTLNFVKSILGDGKTLNEAAAFANSPTGKQIHAGISKKERARQAEAKAEKNK